MTRPTYRVTALADRHAFVKLTDRIALITRTFKRAGKGGRMAKVVAAYLGFDSAIEAHNFVAGLKKYFPRCFVQVRKAERLTAAFEVKIRGFEGLERFIWSFATNAAIIAVAQPISPAEAKDSIFPSYPAPSNVIPFVDRNNAPLISRSAPQTVRVGNRYLSIE
jgi:hypothetical protein